MHPEDYSDGVKRACVYRYSSMFSYDCEALQAQRDTYLMYGSVITCTSGLLKLIWTNMVLILHVCVRESDVGGDRV